MTAGWMHAGDRRPGRRLKAPEEGNRGQQVLCYGDFIEGPGAAVSKLRRVFVVACRKLRAAASRAVTATCDVGHTPMFAIRCTTGNVGL